MHFRKEEGMTTAKPFAKWVGGKRKLAERILTYRPANMQRYVELFVGGGAVFFELRATGYDGPVLLSDVNAELITTYRVIQTDVDVLIAELQGLKNEEKFFYEIRALDSATLSPVERAARFIYLNKTAFNGVWRENLSGKMNVPFGKYENPAICDEENLRAVAQALQNTTIECGSYDEHALCVKAGDFCYFDPPYVPVNETSNFTTYSKGGFSLDWQKALVAWAKHCAKVGAKVVLSNADVPLVHELYGPEFAREQVQMARMINSKVDKRGKVGELLLSIG